MKVTVFDSAPEQCGSVQSSAAMAGKVVGGLDLFYGGGDYFVDLPRTLVLEQTLIVSFVFSHFSSLALAILITSTPFFGGQDAIPLTTFLTSTIISSVILALTTNNIQYSS
jgi:hypothetical protein